jgi:sirohydrochlorin cobaltochelatase
MKRGVLLFAHGARDARWALPFEDIAARIRAGAPSVPVRLCFMEFMSPTLVEGADALVAAGCRRVEVVPLFLGAGGHVRRDIPVLLSRLQAAHPAVEWALHPAIGELDAVIQAMASAALEFLDTTADPR